MPLEKVAGLLVLESLLKFRNKNLLQVVKMAKKKGDARITIHLACTQCRERTYSTSKNKRNDPGRIELNKFCPRCRAHTQYREVK